MDWSVYRRTPTLAACAVAASFAFAACSGAGSTVVSPNAGSTSGTGTGSGSGSGTGTGTGTGSGSATSSPTPSPVATSSGGTGATPTPTPAATTAPSGTSTSSPLSSLIVGPQTVDAALGTTAQIGILDPGYTGPVSVSVVGNQLVGTVLSAVENLQDGVLQGQSGTSDILDIDLAQLLSFKVLGANATVLNVCETAMTPNVCAPVTLTQNAAADQIGSNLSSAVITPGTFQLLMLASKAGVTKVENFTVTSSNNNVTVTNLGNGQYDLGAAANVGTPTTATITATDGMGHTIAIPVMVL